jgi:hypothetical protein
MTGGWTAADVAQWSVHQIRQRGQLTQKQVAYEIRREFGLEFTYTNKNKNPAIDKNVLKLFRELTADGVVWEQGSRRWRLRRPTDPPGSGRC